MVILRRSDSQQYEVPIRITDLKPNPRHLAMHYPNVCFLCHSSTAILPTLQLLCMRWLSGVQFTPPLRILISRSRALILPYLRLVRLIRLKILASLLRPLTQSSSYHEVPECQPNEDDGGNASNDSSNDCASVAAGVMGSSNRLCSGACR